MTYLILTVGTGTAGQHSNLAAGLRRTLDLLQPERFWLVPSTDETSLITADLVRENLPGFQPWSESFPYHAIEKPDSLEDCRRVVREVIQHARKSLPARARLLVNPTSGTKQMSVGAALAALDENIGELVFTIGQREDGVVKTGTETLETFDASTYFKEQDLRAARSLVQAGAWAAAAMLLARHPDLKDQKDIADCMDAWERQNYSRARAIAARGKAPALVAARSHLDQLARDAKGPEPRPSIVADLLQTATILHERRDFENALLLACRSFEMGLRLAFYNLTKLFEPYNLGGICALKIDHAVKDRCRQLSLDGQSVQLDLPTLAKILRQLEDPMGDAYHRFQKSIDIRNKLMHRIRAVTEPESETALRLARELLADLLPPANFPRPVF